MMFTSMLGRSALVEYYSDEREHQCRPAGREIAAGYQMHSALVAVLSGGLLFGAVFMATDYVTSPFTLKGKLVYGVALGIVKVYRDRLL